MKGTMKIQEVRLTSVYYMDVKGVNSECVIMVNPSSAQEVMEDGSFKIRYGK